MVWVSCHYDVMFVMFSCWFVSQQVDHCKYYNELSYKAPSIVCFTYNSLAIIGVVEHQGRCSPKGEGSVTIVVKIPCNKS